MKINTELLFRKKNALKKFWEWYNKDVTGLENVYDKEQLFKLIIENRIERRMLYDFFDSMGIIISVSSIRGDSKYWAINITWEKEAWIFQNTTGNKTREYAEIIAFETAFLRLDRE